MTGEKTKCLDRTEGNRMDSGPWRGQRTVEETDDHREDLER
jgi:hypothetical protein